MTARSEAEREAWRRWVLGAPPPAAPDADQDRHQPVRPGDADAGQRGDGPARVVSAEPLNAYLRGARAQPRWSIPAPARQEDA